VAKGAAIQEAMLSNLSSVKRMSLLDVTNLSLGINELGNKMSKIIKRSTPIPEETSEIYKTVEDNQEEALIEVFEGEDESTKNNLLLDKFYIRNLPLKEKGEVKIKVNFSIDNNSILKVTAYDLQKENHFEKLEIADLKD
jgi:molecular chaperone DnaK